MSWAKCETMHLYTKQVCCNAWDVNTEDFILLRDRGVKLANAKYII